ncbi:hypothetical protein KUCAC02_004063 [Chaenocephalus aceratus]|uniref:Uncharacterized protein n=1 Tax=Chaenocephalus aceratus TaxID=36190 RepID=A0ACB9WXF8_CHAAC|nr:hypothetical protein KUCAC02_004063 [Chaenocephalus aceratus]
MPLENLFGSKGRLVLSALLVCAVILELAYCQEEAQQQKINPGRKPKPSITKLGRSTNKSPRAVTAKPKIKTTAPAQTFLTQVLNRGKFKKVVDSISVQSGDTLELRCRGKPVQWSVPKYLEEDDDEGRLSMVQQERYGVLTLVNTTGADTGEFSCYPMYCEDTDCRKEYDKAVKVFVFFPDPQELFVPSADYYEAIQLRTNWPTLLPCQVTSPQAKVTLHHPMAPPAPVIQASSSSVTAGENLRVSCSVVGEQDVAVEFTWDYPGQQIGRPLYTQDSISPVGGGAARQQSQSVLLVDEVRDVDQGTYTCTAQNLQGAKSVSTTVKVVPKAKPKKQKP